MKRLQAYLLMGAAYAAAFGIGFVIFYVMANDAGQTMRVLLALLTADIAMTAVVWLFGLFYKNSSFYDAYWSLVPWTMLLAVMLRFSLFTPVNILLVCVLGLWSWRLTANWAYTCKDIKTEDWRYTRYRTELSPLRFHFINLIGVHYIPTLCVFAGMVPAFLLVLASPAGFTPLCVIGAAVIVLGTLLEGLADLSMHRFRRENAGNTVNRRGVWKYSRHPNYLGEISVWLGVYLMLVTTLPAYWFHFYGFLAMVLLFLFVSIPLAEKRQLTRRPDYAAYRRTTSMLFLLPNRKDKG